MVFHAEGFVYAPFSGNFTEIPHCSYVRFRLDEMNEIYTFYKEVAEYI
jgi:hypothetical protein